MFESPGNFLMVMFGSNFADWQHLLILAVIRIIQKPIAGDLKMFRRIFEHSSGDYVRRDFEIQENKIEIWAGRLHLLLKFPAYIFIIVATQEHKFKVSVLRYF